MYCSAGVRRVESEGGVEPQDEDEKYGLRVFIAEESRANPKDFSLGAEVFKPVESGKSVRVNCLSYVAVDDKPELYIGYTENVPGEHRLATLDENSKQIKNVEYVANPGSTAAFKQLGEVKMCVAAEGMLAVFCYKSPVKIYKNGELKFAGKELFNISTT